MLAFVARHDLNSQTFEHRAHRRIDVLIRASDLMTTRLQHPCERSHRCPTNPDQVVVHESIKYTLFANLYCSSLNLFRHRVCLRVTTTPADISAQRYGTASGSDRNLLDSLIKHDPKSAHLFLPRRRNDPVATARGSLTTGEPFFSKMGFLVPKVKLPT